MSPPTPSAFVRCSSPNDADRKGPAPSLKPHPIWGHLPAFRADRLAFLELCARSAGDIVPVRLGPIRIMLLNHPDLVEEVLVAKNKSFRKHFALRQARPSLGEGLLTSEGETWRRQRKLAQPAFHRDRIAAYAEIMVRRTLNRLATWSHGQTRDLHEDMMSLTLEIVSECLFGADVSGSTAAAGAAMDVLTRAFTERVNRLIPVPSFIPTPSNVRFNRAKRRLEEILKGIIAERRRLGEDRGDLLAMLLAATDEESGARMTDKMLRDEAMTLFLAGHETTANTLVWAFYALAKHPRAEERLHAELTEALGSRPPECADLARMPYVEAVILETLRLHPTVWLLGREALEPVEIGGARIAKGMTVWMSQWVIQRDPRFFADPLAFEPERWLDGLIKRIPRYAYFPFGGGPRICIGDGFAKTEAALLLAAIAQRYKLSLVPGAVVEHVPTITLRPAGAVPMVVTQRGE